MIGTPEIEEMREAEGAVPHSVCWSDMAVVGTYVSANWQTTAWERTREAGDLALLERYLVKSADLPPPWSDQLPDHWFISEIANRMRQKARRAGVIKLVGKPRSWQFT